MMDTMVKMVKIMVKMGKMGKMGQIGLNCHRQTGNGHYFLAATQSIGTKALHVHHHKRHREGCHKPQEVCMVAGCLAQQLVKWLLKMPKMPKMLKMPKMVKIKPP